MRTLLVRLAELCSNSPASSRRLALLTLVRVSVDTELFNENRAAKTMAIVINMATLIHTVIFLIVINKISANPLRLEV